MKRISSFVFASVAATTGCLTPLDEADDDNVEADGENVESEDDVLVLARGAGGNAVAPIVFESTRSGDFELYMVNPDGSGLRRLTSTPDHNERFPRWSPDRTRVGFIRMPIGGFVSQLCWKTFDANLNEISDVCGPDVANTFGDLAWRPDGSGMVYVVDGVVGYSLGLSTYYVVKSAPYVNQTARTIDVAKDGRILMVDTEGRTLSSTTINGGTPTLIYNDNSPTRYNMWGAAWSPDAKTIAYSMTEIATSHAQIFKVRADGTGVTQLTNAARSSSYPTWSPDGKKLAFQASHFAGQPMRLELMRMSANGTGLANITSAANGTHDQNPAW